MSNPGAHRSREEEEHLSAEEEEHFPAEQETSTSHPRSGSRGGDSREVVGANRSILHTDSVRQVTADGTNSREVRREAAGEGDGAVGSGGSSTSSPDSDDRYFSSKDSEYDYEDRHRRRSRRSSRRSRSPSHHHHREAFGGGASSSSSSFLNSTNVKALNNLITEHLAKGETAQDKPWAHPDPPAAASLGLDGDPLREGRLKAYLFLVFMTIIVGIWVYRKFVKRDRNPFFYVEPTASENAEVSEEQGRTAREARLKRFVEQKRSYADIMAEAAGGGTPDSDDSDNNDNDGSSSGGGGGGGSASAGDGAAGSEGLRHRGDKRGD